MVFHPDQSGLFAMGSYSGQIALYDASNNEQVWVKKGMDAISEVRTMYEMNARFGFLMMVYACL
jgi:hypothetical protein